MFALTKLRKQQGLSQAKLSQCTGLAVSTLSRLESKHFLEQVSAPVSTVLKLAQALGMPPGDLLTVLLANPETSEAPDDPGEV